FLLKIVAHRPTARGRKAVYGSYRFVDNGHEAVGGLASWLGSAGQGRIRPRRSALISREPKKVQATPLDGLPMRLGLARSRGFDFLAYLLAMALKEAWRLAGQ